MSRPKVAILNEHPTWQIGLCEELRRRDINYYEIAIHDTYFSLSSDEFRDIDLVINRSSPSAARRNHRASLFFTLQLIEHLERLGIPVINGSQAYLLEISKARQYQLFQRVGLPFPHTVIVNSPQQAIRAARNLNFPLVLKPNIGGSGSGYTFFEQHEHLTIAKATRVFELSADNTAVLQEYLQPEDQKRYRVQMIGPRYCYTVCATGGGSNTCLADDCASHDSDPDVSLQDCGDPRPQFSNHTESQEVIDEVTQVAIAGGLDTCGVEYLIHSGKRYYFDINAMSVFANKAQFDFDPNMDPTAEFVNFIEQRLSEAHADRLSEYL